MEQNEIQSNSNSKPDFYNELRVRVKEYFEHNKKSKYGTAQITIKSIVMMVLYLAPFLLMTFGLVTTVYGLFICWILMSIGMAGIGLGMMHDANHGSFSKYPSLNKLMGRSLYLLGGYRPTWIYQHNNLHHGYTNIDGHDEDIQSLSIFRFSPNQPLKKIHRFQHFYVWAFYGLMTISWITIKDFAQLSNYLKRNVVLNKNKNKRRLYTDLIIAKSLYYFIFLVIPLLTVPLAWYWILTGFIVMHFICGLILTTIFQTAHVMPTSTFPKGDENGMVESHWAIHQLYNTTNYAPKSKLFFWLVGGLNFQVEHHLFPNISHIHYRNLSTIVRETTKKYNLPYYVQSSFFQAIKSHFKMLAMLGRQKAML